MLERSLVLKRLLEEGGATDIHIIEQGRDGADWGMAYLSVARTSIEDLLQMKVQSILTGISSSELKVPELCDSPSRFSLALDSPQTISLPDGPHRVLSDRGRVLTPFKPICGSQPEKTGS